MLGILIVALMAGTSSAAWTHLKNHKQTNFLYIMYDDLRPELSIYGRKHMKTPNFERLAKRSVIFDNAYVQVAVCNPSRDSILTGLRPDTVGTYGFQHSFGPHMLLPEQLVKSKYQTAAFGKMLHWDGDSKNVWSAESWQGGWYDYQNLEWSFMKASVQPDAERNESDFRDHMIATKAIDRLRKFHGQLVPKSPTANQTDFFMVGVGFKLPHITLHVPYKHYMMYKGLQVPNMTLAELQFSSKTSPAVGYRCCGENTYRFVNEDGTKRAVETKQLGNMNEPVPLRVYNEIMTGYCAGISFLDDQLGRILDVLDELNLWDKLTIVLSSDHGMHNGEKGMW